jgi:hypothetical protein
MAIWLPYKVIELTYIRSLLIECEKTLADDELLLLCI